ncbi:MAG: hypothetical protein ACREF3_20175 [Acetobacteraceae bacterium]
MAIDFGQNGTDAGYLGSGWSGPEEGYRWAIGPQSELWLNNPGGTGDYVLELDIGPFVLPPAITAQRFSISLRGALVGRSTLSVRGQVGYRVPGSLFAEPGPLRLIFDHPDATPPNKLAAHRDSRPLAVCFYSLRLSRVAGDIETVRLEPWKGVVPAEIGKLAGTPALRFMLNFESLGDNCEFGLVQRRCGAEPLGLLRFSNLELHRLLWCLETQFDGLGEISHLEYRLSEGNKPEYVIRDRRSSLVFHTFLHEGEVTEADLLPQQARRLNLLRRKILEDLHNGEKIFVCKRNVTLSEQEILPLHAALNRYGPNSLLWVVSGDGAHPPGTVDQLMPGLMRGYIDRFAPYENAHDLSLEAWLSITVNAFLMQREARKASPSEHAAQ